MNPKKTLFVVHREDILVKALESFDNVLRKTIPDYSSEIYKGSKHNKDCKYLFVTEATLSLHLEDFAPDEFEYIIINEAHYAADNSYTKILNYFKPKFLLGLTATPERTYGKDIFSIFDFNRAVNIRLRDSLEKDLVCPFHFVRKFKEVESIPQEFIYLGEVSTMKDTARGGMSCNYEFCNSRITGRFI